MSRKGLFRYLAFLSISFLPVTPMYGNLIWPAMFVAQALYTSFSLVLVSVFIEGFLLHHYLKNLSYSKAFLMACVGNAISTLIGTALMTFAMLLWHMAVDPFLGGTFHFVNHIATFVVMYLGTSCIELFSIMVIFRYTRKELFLPVFIGNLMTYLLILPLLLSK